MEHADLAKVHKRSHFDLLTLSLLGCACGFCIALSLLMIPSPASVFGAVFGVLVVAIAFKDWQALRIPDPLIFAAFITGIAELCLAGASTDLLVHALLRSAVSGFAFWMIRRVYAMTRGRQGLGLADVKLAFVAGLWLDWSLLLAAVELACITNIAYWLFRFFSRSRLGVTDRMPFGLFFASSIWLCWLVGASRLDLNLFDGLQRGL